ncbi:hypothetical protein N7465_011313 [Penicillium sp. CMV-2018d]|nr:hypothetical protein N7465_011313 [Penicillium sp. CMV-2018d]
MSNKTLKQWYPVDFDGNGMIKASRTPEDPASLIRAHGLPLIAVARARPTSCIRANDLVGSFAAFCGGFRAPRSSAIHPIRHTVALTGRQHASLGAALQDKNDKNIKAARSAFAIGTLVAPRSFVDMPRTIDRQLFTHTGTYLDAHKTEAALARANFPKEFKPACNARDTMSSLHNALAVLMGDPLAVVRLMVQHHTMEPITDTTTSIEQSTHERA